MIENIRTILDSISTLISAIADLAWPLLVLVIFFSLRGEIIKIFPRLKKFKVFGSEVEVADLTPKEVEERNEAQLEEVQEVNEEDESEPELEEIKVTEEDYSPRITKDNYLKLLPYVENLALSKFEDSVNFSIRKNVRVGNLGFDGYGKNPAGKQYFIEVKVFPNILDSRGGIKTSLIMSRVNKWASQTIVKLSRHAEKAENRFPLSLVFVLVFDTAQDLSNMRRKVSRLKAEYNKSDSKVQVKFVFYNLNKLES